MHDPFNAHRFLSHIRARWRLPVASITVAVAAALLISLLLPARYTAIVSVVIEPPAAGDPRMATAVSPIYLESLRTYEHFAASDQLFERAVERFKLRGNSWFSKSIESLKQSVLHVSLQRNTKVLEIAATLKDPRQAHELALFVAEQTIDLNRQTNLVGSADLVAQARKDLAEATIQANAVEAEYQALQKRQPSPDALKAGLGELAEMRLDVERLKLAAELSAGEQEDREKTAASTGRGAADDSADGKARLQVLRARAERLRRQVADLERQAASKQEALAGRVAEVEAAGAARGRARAIQDQAQKRLLDLQSAVGLVGERLALLDTGVVPERPSWPNIPLNLFLAAALGAFLSFLYLTVEFSLRIGAQESEADREGGWVRSRS